MISLHKHSISATIKERYASIVYLFDFENMSQQKSEELKFEITIDSDAFISKFIAAIDGELFYGKTKEKEAAKQEYSEAKRNDENAILISQPHANIPNIFQIKTNIDSKSKISLKITIEQYLKKTFNFNQLNIQILRSFNKYNIAQNFDFIAFEFNISDLSGIYDVNIPISSDIIIQNKTMDKLHKNCMISGQIMTKTSAMNEFALKYKIKGEENDSYMLFDRGSNTFCHIISDVITDSMIEQCDDDEKEGNDDDIKRNVLIPRRVVFVIDKSGSMRGPKWNKTMSATITALSQLRALSDRFCVILFDKIIDLVPCTGMMPVNEDSIQQTVQYIKSQTVNGGTDINNALLAAIRMIKNDIVNLNKQTADGKAANYNFFMNQIIFITDGEPNCGVTNPKQIMSNVGSANTLSGIDKYFNKISIFSFGVGTDNNDSSWIKDLNHSLLKLLSVNNCGYYKRIKQNSADTDLAANYDILSKPILSNISVKYDNAGITNVTNTAFDSLYAGNDIIICGQIENDEKNELDVSLTISAITGKEMKLNDGTLVTKPIQIYKKMQLQMLTNADEENKNIERIWAYLRLKQFANNKLMDNTASNDMLSPLSLAMKFKFVTPWTSMIVVKKKDNKQIETESQVVQKSDYDSNERKTRSLYAKAGYLPTTNRFSRTDSYGAVKKAQSTQKCVKFDAVKSTEHKPAISDCYGVLKAEESKSNVSERDFYKTFWIEAGRIGEGAFSRIRTITRKADKRKFALKMIKKKGRSMAEIKCALHAIEILKQCKHENIIHLESWCDTKKRLYIVVEMSEVGEINLIQYIINAADKKWSQHKMVNIIKQIVGGLQHLHSLGFVHRDLRPANIQYFGRKSLVKICEFEFAADCNKGPCKERPYGISLLYAAPEIVESAPHNQAADLWSLGCLIYLLLCGSVPFFDDTNNVKHLSKLIVAAQYSFSSPFWEHRSKKAKDLIQKLLIKDPTKRLNAKQVLEHEWIKSDDNANYKQFGDEYFKQILLYQSLCQIAC